MDSEYVKEVFVSSTFNQLILALTDLGILRSNHVLQLVDLLLQHLFEICSVAYLVYEILCCLIAIVKRFGKSLFRLFEILLCLQEFLLLHDDVFTEPVCLFLLLINSYLAHQDLSAVPDELFDIFLLLISNRQVLQSITIWSRRSLTK